MSTVISNHPISTRIPMAAKGNLLSTPRKKPTFKFELTSDELNSMTTLERNKRNKRLTRIKARGTKEERKKARERLIVENMALAPATVKRDFLEWYSPCPGGKRFNYTLKQDLIDVARGPDGLIKAADTFNLKEGCEFSTHAINKMRRAVRQYLLEQHQALPLRTADANRLRKLSFNTEKEEVQGVNVTSYAIGGLRRLGTTRTVGLSKQLENTIEATGAPEDIENDDLLSLPYNMRNALKGLGKKNPLYRFACELFVLIEKEGLSVSSNSGNEDFFSLPYNMRCALRELGKKNSLYRLVIELFVLSNMTEGWILKIAKGEISPDIISNSITVAINKSSEVLREIMSNPPKPPVIDGASFTIKDLIEALVKNPQWTLLLSKNEGDAILKYYSLEESHEHECYDTVSRAIDIAKIMINEKTGKLGISKQRVLQYLDTARRKLIGLYTGSYTASDAAQSQANYFAQNRATYSVQRSDNFSLELYNKLLAINLNSSKQF